MFAYVVKNKRSIVGISASIFYLCFCVYKIFAAPNTPTNTSPSNGATSVSLTPTLTSSAYSNARDNSTSSDGFVDLGGSNDMTGQNMESGDITTTSAGGASSKAIDIDGSNEYAKKVGFSYANDLASGGKSLSFWVRFDTTPPGNVNTRIFALYEDSLPSNTPFYFIGYYGAGSPNRWLVQTRKRQGGGYQTPQDYWNDTSLSANTWYNMVFTTNGTEVKLYKNGSLLTHTNDILAGMWFGDPGNLHSSLIYSTGTIHFGSSNGPSTLLDGKLDEVTYWNTELDSTEVSELYNSGSPIDPTTHSEASNLRGYWPLGEEIEHKASQWQITDTSGNYGSPIYDSGTDTSNLTSVAIPSSTLDESTTYYWRVRHQDMEGDWSSWSTETSFTTLSSGALSVDIVDSGGTTVSSPSMSMDSTEFSFSSQTATGTFGTSSEKIRVENTTAGDVWTLSLAASATTDVWDSAGTDYDFNDPTASAGDGADSDSVGGQMTIDPSSITISPEGGCTTDNISAGSSTAFSEGVTDSITIAAADTGADTGCYWDITDIDISQTIPAEQPVASDYNIDMVLSIVAS